jgi:hypothetical protein
MTHGGTGLHLNEGCVRERERERDYLNNRLFEEY